MRTYTDARTNELKPLHKPYGATFFVPNPATWTVASQGQLMDATKKAGNGGGLVHLEDLFMVDEVVSVPSGTKLMGGGIRAADGFKHDGHLLHIRNGARDVWLDNVELDAAGQDIRTVPIMENAQNIILTNCRFHGGQVGVTISGGASNIAILNCESYDHHLWHGFVVQHTDCESIVIAGCRAYRCAAYGIDSHGTRVIIAGNEVFDNGQDSDKYDGGCIKLPEAAWHYVYGNLLQNNGRGGYGCVWTYGDPAKGQRRPSNVFVYRNDLIGSPHMRVGSGATLTYWDNETMRMIDGEPQPTPLVKLGSGAVTSDPSLDQYPTQIEDKTDPIDPPTEPDEPTEYITAAQAEAIARRVFGEMVQTIELDVEISYEE